VERGIKEKLLSWDYYEERILRKEKAQDLEMVLWSGPAGIDSPLYSLNLKMEPNSVPEIWWVLQTDTMNKVHTLGVECDNAVTIERTN